MSLVVLGAGSWGTTIASLVRPRAATTLWARSESVAARNTRSPDERLVSGGLPAVGSTAHDIVARRRPERRRAHRDRAPEPWVPRCSARRRGRCRRACPFSACRRASSRGRWPVSRRIVDACWPGHPVGVLTGPNLAAEVCEGRPTASVIAFADEDLAAEIRDLFTTETLRLYTNPDVTGCEIAGAVKNVLAIASGMSVGLGFGDKTRGPPSSLARSPNSPVSESP